MTTAQRTRLEEQITEALAEVRAARVERDRCPSAERQEFLVSAEFRLDRLVDRLPIRREQD